MHLLPRQNNYISKGFTLVEISVVLVIISLLVGGILVGSDLIKSAQLRYLISDVNKFKVAIQTFREKYNCVPGDCATATTFFATSANGCPGNVPDGTGVGTCNGNGNGMIDSGWTNGNNDLSHAGNSEPFLLWQHLSLANLISGKYTGVSDCRSGGACIVAASDNAPFMQAYNSVYQVDQMPTSNAYITPATNPKIDEIIFVANDGWDRTPNLPPVDAYYIDNKMDDGLPAFGSVQADGLLNQSNPYPPACVTTYIRATSLYNVTDLSKQCYMRFINVF